MFTGVLTFHLKTEPKTNIVVSLYDYNTKTESGVQNPNSCECANSLLTTSHVYPITQATHWNIAHVQWCYLIGNGIYQYWCS